MVLKSIRDLNGASCFELCWSFLVQHYNTPQISSLSVLPSVLSCQNKRDKIDYDRLFYCILRDPPGNNVVDPFNRLRRL